MLTHPQDRKLLWKLDLKLIPWLSFLYLISFLDRTNIGNAKLDGLQQDLHMTDSQYNESLTIFFVSYSVFEPLTNILLKKLRPSIFLPIIMVLWGICMTCMGLVHNYAGLMTARWWLGVAEAGKSAMCGHDCEVYVDIEFQVFSPVSEP
jgi:sugar phosphate permease